MNLVELLKHSALSEPLKGFEMLKKKGAQMTEQEIQRKYLQLQMLKQQLSALLEEKNIVDEKISEILTTTNALNELGKVKQNEEIWSPLGSGAFVRSDIKDRGKVLIGIGSDVVIKESRTKAIEILQERLKEIIEIDKELSAEIEKFNSQITKLEPEIQEMIQNEQKSK